MVSDVAKVMDYSDDLDKVVSIVARIMAAQKEGRPAACKAPTGIRRRQACRLLFIVESQKAGSEVKRKMTTLAPCVEDGMWVTRGRLAKGLPGILGVDRLPVLLPNSRLAELLMIQAHRENHDGAPGTLARSRPRLGSTGVEILLGR